MRLCALRKGDFEEIVEPMTPDSGGCGFIPRRQLERLAKHRCLDKATLDAAKVY